MNAIHYTARKIKLAVTCLNLEVNRYRLNFYFLLFQTHFHTLQNPKTQENKNHTKDKIEPQHIQF